MTDGLVLCTVGLALRPLLGVGSWPPCPILSGDASSVKTRQKLRQPVFICPCFSALILIPIFPDLGTTKTPAKIDTVTPFLP